MHKLFNKFIRNLLVYDKSLRCNTTLTAINESTFDCSIGRFLNICIIAYYERITSTKLENTFLYLGGCSLCYCSSCRNGTCEWILMLTDNRRSILIQIYHLFVKIMIMTEKGCRLIPLFFLVYHQVISNMILKQQMLLE